MGKRRMASRRLPSLPFLLSWRSFFHRLQETVSTCAHVHTLGCILIRLCHNGVYSLHSSACATVPENTHKHQGFVAQTSKPCDARPVLVSHTCRHEWLCCGLMSGCS